MEKQLRNYSLDLLRIVSMFMILLLHAGSHGGGGGIFLMSPLTMSVAVYGVNLFVLISGYFVSTQVLRPSRVWKLLVVMAFYAWIWLGLSYIMHNNTESLTIKSLLLNPYHQYWFIWQYLWVYISSPLWNFIISKVSKYLHLFIIVALLAYMTFVPDIRFLVTGQDSINLGYSWRWFIALYFIAAYIRKYAVADKFKTKKILLVGYGICCCLLFGSWLYLEPDKYALFERNSITYYFYRYNSVITLAGSVSLFLYFVKSKVSREKVVKLVTLASPLILGVYLIHDNEFGREYIWKGLSVVQLDGWSILWYLAYVFFVFIACLVIDYARTKAFGIVNKRTWYKNTLTAMDNKVAEIFVKLRLSC